jgi:hypothetical protein
MLDRIRTRLAQLLVDRKPPSCIRVLLFQEGEHWIAQGLEIDYASAGESLADAQERFITGLSLTMEEHLAKYNSLTKLVRPAPQHVWQMYLENEADFEPKMRKTQANSSIPAFNCLAFMRPSEAAHI